MKIYHFRQSARRDFVLAFARERGAKAWTTADLVSSALERIPHKLTRNVDRLDLVDKLADLTHAGHILRNAQQPGRTTYRIATRPKPDPK